MALYDEKFWIATAFVILVAALFKKISNILTTGLDKASKDIEDQLKKASLIKKEAGEIREAHLQQKKLNEKKAKQIIDNAENTAEKILNDAGSNLKTANSLKLSQAKALIAKMEADALSEMRSAALQQALDKFCDYMKKNSKETKLYESSIESLKKAI